ncbi:hypothetical protein GCM10022414_16130 [Zhongshania borealis]|uniref:Uncharacterized protein n=1 Tax=Zhongshania borealis TaxID=889488 RepID=A0ABP7WP67_9GAMM
MSVTQNRMPLQGCTAKSIWVADQIRDDGGGTPPFAVLFNKKYHTDEWWLIKRYQRTPLVMPDLIRHPFSANPSKTTGSNNARMDTLTGLQ